MDFEAEGIFNRRILYVVYLFILKFQVILFKNDLRT